jgi:hypothetical protein
MPVARVVITKQITWKGAPERWSNGYRFNLPTIDQATIQALAAALITWERNQHAARVSFVYANGGRDAAGAQAVYAEEFTTPQVGGGVNFAIHPEVCVLMERKRRAKVYARKWYHLGLNFYGPNTAPEVIPTAARDSVNTWIAKLTDGSLPGGAVYCWPDGTALDGPFTCDAYLRTRQFPRRSPRKVLPVVAP